MKKLGLAYDRQKSWAEYWKLHRIDQQQMHDLDIYPIRMTLRHLRAGQRIVECGFGAGRVIRHLNKHGHAWLDRLGQIHGRPPSNELLGV